MTETESRPRNRALVASFLFTDLVGYSKGTAADQYAAKATLSEILGRNLADLRKEDYRIKDTGDGALIAFLASPEHALYVALAIAHDFARAASAAGFPSNNVRTGLHIGAVKEAIDLESRPNFVGDGINAAQRIMDFAAPGQITASRAYFEAVSWLDSAYAALFQHLGASNDKHGRPHELYAVAPSDEVLEKLRRDLKNAGRDDDTQSGAPASVAPPDRKSVAKTRAVDANRSEPPAAGARKWYVPLGALVAIAVAASIFFVARNQAPNGAALPPAQSKASPVDTKPAAAPARPEIAPPSAAAPNLASPSAASPSVEPAPGKPELALPAATPKSDVAPVTRSAPQTNAPPVPASRAVPTMRSSPANAGADVQRKVEPPGVSPAATMSSAPASARCRHILEKVQIGEPLSQDEKRELASSCR